MPISDEIIRTGQRLWTIISLIVYSSIMALVLLHFQSVPLILDGLVSGELEMLAVCVPLLVLLPGLLLGVLRKRSIRLDTSGFTYTEKSCSHQEFYSHYENIVSSSGGLGGESGWLLVWIILLAYASFPGILLEFAIGNWPGEMALTVVVLFVIIPLIFLFPLGLYSAQRFVAIGNKAFSNPLAWEIDEYVQVSNFLDRMQRCDCTASVIVRYREGVGTNLKVIDNVHALIITSTEPSLEIEVDITSMRTRGPVYMLGLSKRLPFQRTEVLKVAGLDALLTVSDGVAGSTIRIRYKVNRIRAGWTLNDSKKICALLQAAITEGMRYMQEGYESN
jgi:hypothetical protein